MDQPKLVGQRHSVCSEKERGSPIFDMKTYQQAFQRKLCAISSQKSQTTNYRRLSFSQYSNKSERKELNYKGNRIMLKQEIKPHDPKTISNRVTSLIREKIQNAKQMRNTDCSKNRLTNSTFNNKYPYHGSHSSYIMARKKVFEKQSSVSLSSQFDCPNFQPKQKYGQLQVLDIQNKEKQLLILKPVVFEAKSFHDKKEQSKTQTQQTSVVTSQRRKNIEYLEKIITNNVRKTQLGYLNVASSMYKQGIVSNTPTLKRNFIAVVRKKSSGFSFMVNSSKREKLKNILEPQVSYFDSFLKNFIGQKNIQQQEIQLFPHIIKVQSNRCSQLRKQLFGDITSKSVMILHIKKENIKQVLTVNDKQKLQIASITKIMTCFLVLTIAQTFCLDITKEKSIVSERASKIQGTSAKLSYSDSCTIYEMLHGLMLPSGNDAAIALGEWGGKVIRRFSALMQKLKPSDSSEKSEKSLNFLSTYAVKKKSHMKLFVHHMNKLSKFLQMRHTHFVNTHGLMNEKAYSCSHDIALLSYYAMKNSIFRQIVSKKQYKCTVFNRTFSHSKDFCWENTNKLLNIDGFAGVKTGITPSAGPCLSSLFQISQTEYFITVILRTKSCQMRFKETISLLKTTLQNLTSSESDPKYYKRALINLQKYSKINMNEEQLEMLNDCRQSTTSNSDRSEEEDLQLSNFLQ